MPFDSEGAIARHDFGFFELLESSTVILRHESENRLSVCLCLAATVELATFAAWASVGNDSASNKSMLVHKSSFPSNEVLLIEENNYRRISVLKSPLFPPHRGSSHLIARLCVRRPRRSKVLRSCA